MRITYDDEAHAGYIYFTSIEAGGVAETIPSQELKVDLDGNGQIIAMQILESEECEFRDRLKFVPQHPYVAYDEAERSIRINFVESPKAKVTIFWDAHVDLDADGQIRGLEILFADPEFEPDDGLKRLYAGDKLEHMARYIVPFDELH